MLLISAYLLDIYFIYKIMKKKKSLISIACFGIKHMINIKEYLVNISK
jgi:hypothetical protein